MSDGVDAVDALQSMAIFLVILMVWAVANKTEEHLGRIEAALGTIKTVCETTPDIYK